MAQSGFIQTNRITTYYQTIGDFKSGIPLEFIRALRTDLHIWDAVLPHFDGVPTLRYDTRGHGLSDAEGDA